MFYQQHFYRDQALAWRIIAAVLVFQLAGGFIGAAYDYHHSAFMNLWAGGALATLPGFILGAIWHFSGPVDRRARLKIASFLGLLTAALFFGGRLLGNSWNEIGYADARDPLAIRLQANRPDRDIRPGPRDENPDRHRTHYHRRVHSVDIGCRWAFAKPSKVQPLMVRDCFRSDAV